MDKRKRADDFSKKLDEMILGRKRPRLTNDAISTNKDNDDTTSANQILEGIAIKIINNLKS